MPLREEFEQHGNWLFKRRSWLPLLLYPFAVAVIYYYQETTHLYITSPRWGLLCFAVSILGLVVRALTVGFTPKGTSGRNTDVGQVAESLNQTGIYSVVRHPLYLGNFLMWLGIVAYTANFYFVIIVSLLYWLYYERIMFAEERFLEKKFGQSYLDWSLKAPAFIPKFSQFVSPSVSFSMISVLRREYSGVLATVIGFIFVDVLRDYSIHHQFVYNETHYWVLGITAAITLLLRFLKRKTKLLNEEGRS